MTSHPAQPHVYLIVWGNYVKIGCSVDPIDRLRRCTQRGARPPRAHGDPELIASAPGDLQLEAWLHIALAGHRANGEWFHKRGPVADLVALAESGSTRAFPTFPGRPKPEQGERTA